MAKKRRGSKSGKRSLTRPSSRAKRAPRTDNLTSRKPKPKARETREPSRKRSTVPSASSPKSRQSKPRSPKSRGSARTSSESRKPREKAPPPRQDRLGRAITRPPAVPAPKKKFGGHAPPGAVPFASLTPAEKHERRSDAAKRGHARRRAREAERETQRWSVATTPGETQDYDWGFYDRIHPRLTGEPEFVELWQGRVKEYEGRRVALVVNGTRTNKVTRKETRTYVRRVFQCESYDDFLAAFRSAIKAIKDWDTKDSLKTRSITLSFADDDDFGDTERA